MKLAAIGYAGSRHEMCCRSIRFHKYISVRRARMRLCALDLLKSTMPLRDDEALSPGLPYSYCRSPCRDSVQRLFQLQFSPPIAILDFIRPIVRIFWLRQNTAADESVLMPKEECVDITIISDAEKTISLNNVPADKSLDAYLISKAKAELLSAPYMGTTTLQTSVTDSKGHKHTVIGKVELGWHKRDSSKSFRCDFLVVEVLSTGAMLGKDTLQKAKESTAHPIGLNKQTAGILKPIPQEIRRT